MEILEQRILKDGAVKEGGILKVDSFLNHQCDIQLYNEMGKAFAAHFSGKNITKILTIEASGIGIACIAAQYFNCPVVFAKKAKSLNLDGSLYTASVHSYTYDKEYTITVSSKFVTSSDTVLLIDDFLANGQAMLGLIDIVKKAGAELAGVGIVIEKGFQTGGEQLRSMGIDLCSLAIIDEMRPGFIRFRKD
ncbi:MAG: xanthine phosphoribosyltransferase [Christensenellales bacterium]|jgi:xanthine phosphoribosyltransferase